MRIIRLAASLLFIVAVVSACRSTPPPTTTTVPVQSPTQQRPTTSAGPPSPTFSPTTTSTAVVPPPTTSTINTSTTTATSTVATSTRPTSTPSATSNASRNVITFDSRTLTNNTWGAPSFEIFNSGVYVNSNNTYGWFWEREDPKIVPGNTLVVPIFPNVRIGGGPEIKSNSKYFPISTSNITSLRFNTSYDYLLPPTGAYNLAYEMFFSKTNQPGPNLIPDAEVMIWIHATFGQPPSTYQGDFTDGNNNYQLYSWERPDGRLYASFIMEGDPVFQANHIVDAKKLLDYLHLNPDWYLLGVELGSEVVNGSGRIEITKLSVSLNGSET